MLNTVIFLAVMFLIYNYLLFELVDTLLKAPKLKKILRIPVGIVNAVIVIAFTILSKDTSTGCYIIIGIILFAEFVLFYKDKYTCSLFCMLACVLHLMAFRALCIAFFTLVTHNTIYNIVDKPYSLALSTGVMFMVLNIATLFVLKLVPAKGVRIINQHSEQLFFMIAWLAVFSIYLLINAYVYDSPNSHPTLLVNQIVAPITILIGTYIVLFFSIKTGTLLGYKEKTVELQHTMEKERQYHTTIDKSVFRVIEVNFTRGEIISGFDDYKEKLGATIYNYKKMLTFVIRTTVHRDDRDEFIKYISPLTMVEEFKMGTTEISFDYRMRTSDNDYVWMRLLLVLVQDAQSEDIKGYVQIKNIDIEKKQQLELQYKAERDLLTGLYNKTTTELLISKQLNPDNETAVSGALFIIDIDNFKTINDRLGHLYGDAVLSEISENLRKIFRDSDIVGRVGGDEFLAFSKDLQTKNAVIKKADGICAALLQTYANERNEGYTVSSSIGIAMLPDNGDSFDALFRCADIALYTAKAQGKNRYSFYDKNSKMDYNPSRTEIDTHGIVQKSFRKNRIEYVFRLLYGSVDTNAAIEAGLELIAKNFGFSRANIFEFNELSTHFNGVFEWCAVGIESVSANYIDLPLKDFDFVVSALERAGGMFMAVPADFPAYARESYTSIGIKYIVHFSILERDKLIGVIAFQHCINHNFQLSNTEFEELRTICQVLSVFMAKQLSNERELRHHQAIEAVMDNMNSIAYVIDRETYEVYYENQNTVNITGHTSIGTKCYFSYRGYERPCEDCPLAHLSKDNPRCTLELYNAKYQIYTKTSAALLEWANDRSAMLLSSVDVTEYK